MPNDSTFLDVNRESPKLSRARSSTGLDIFLSLKDVDRNKSSIWMKEICWHLLRKLLEWRSAEKPSCHFQTSLGGRGGFCYRKVIKVNGKEEPITVVGRAMCINVWKDWHHRSRSRRLYYHKIDTQRHEARQCKALSNLITIHIHASPSLGVSHAMNLTC